MVLGQGPNSFFFMQMSSFPRPFMEKTAFMPVLCCFDYCRSVVSFEIRKHKSFNFVLFRDCFGYLGSLKIPYEFQNGFFFFCKNIIVVLRDSLESWVALSSVDIFKILSFIIRERGLSLHLCPYFQPCFFVCLSSISLVNSYVFYSF